MGYWILIFILFYLCLNAGLMLFTYGSMKGCKDSHGAWTMTVLLFTMTPFLADLLSFIYIRSIWGQVMPEKRGGIIEVNE